MSVVRLTVGRAGDTVQQAKGGWKILSAGQREES
jgi:hypothetical protein